jgi:hypothetical protein
MQKHVELLAILRIVYSAIGLLIGVVIFVLLPGIGWASGDPTALKVLQIIGSVLGGFLIVFSIPGIIAGVGLLKLRPWARILTIILACLDIFSIPIGTALGVYSFWVLMNDKTIKLFTNN